MHFLCDRIKLTEALQILQNVVGTNTTLPILSNIYIDTVDKNTLALTANNLEVGIHIKIDATVGEQGSCTLPGKKLYEITREMIGSNVEIEISSDYVGVIKSGNAVYRIMGMSGEDYPPMPRLDKAHNVKISEEMLRELLRKTSYAISNDETRYLLNGVYMVISKGEIIVVATDGRRLAMVKKISEIDANLEVAVIIPARTVAELMRLIHGEGDMEILFCENQVGFKKNNVMMVSKLIEGKFPNYEQVIPKKSRERVLLNKQEFMSVIRRVALITSGKSNLVKFSFNKGLLTLTASNPDIGEAKDDMNVDYSGEEFSIAFNPSYLTEALKVMDEEQIAFEFTESNLPGVIKSDDSFTYVIMPMKLR